MEQHRDALQDNRMAENKLAGLIELYNRSR